MNDHRRRIEELAKDPAHDGKVSPKSTREAEVGIALEQSGKLKSPIRRDPRPEGGDFVDANGKVWDVKAFDSRWPPIEKLHEAIESNGWSDKILWYP